MKYLIAAVFTNSGLAKNSGNPYSMTRAVVLMPFTDVDNAKFQSHGSGLSPVELSVDSSCSTQLQNHFNAQFKGFPLEIDVKTSLDREGRNIITGLVSPVSMPMSKVS